MGTTEGSEKECREHLNIIQKLVGEKLKYKIKIVELEAIIKT